MTHLYTLTGPYGRTRLYVSRGYAAIEGEPGDYRPVARADVAHLFRVWHRTAVHSGHRYQLSRERLEA